MLLTTKNIITLLLIFAFLSGFQIQTIAQDNSVTYTTEESVENEVNFKYFDINQFEQKLLFRVNLVGSENLVSFSSTGTVRNRSELPLITSFGIEYKVRPSISIDLEGMVSGFLNEYESSWINPGIRYYPNKRLKSKSINNRVNNFSGQYFRFGYFHRINDLEDNYYADSGYRFSYGIQQKSQKWDYVDVSAVLAYNSRFGIFDLSTRIVSGFSYAKSKRPKDQPLVEIENEEVSWNKPIIEIDNLYMQLRSLRFQINMALEGEFHLFKFWTIKPRIGSNFINNRSFANLSTNGKTITYGYNASLAVRKYLGVLKRMSNGYNVKPFSGYYVTVNFANIYERMEFFDLNDFMRDDINRFNFAPQLGVGWQDRLGKRFLFDSNLSFGYDPNIDAFDVYYNFGVGILLNR